MYCCSKQVIASETAASISPWVLTTASALPFSYRPARVLLWAGTGRASSPDLLSFTGASTPDRDHVASFIVGLPHDPPKRLPACSPDEGNMCLVAGCPTAGLSWFIHLEQSA